MWDDLKVLAKAQADILPLFEDEDRAREFSVAV